MANKKATRQTANRFFVSIFYVLLLHRIPQRRIEDVEFTFAYRNSWGLWFYRAYRL